MEHELDGWMTMIWRVLIGVGDSVFEKRKKKKREIRRRERIMGGEKIVITVKHHY